MPKSVNLKCFQVRSSRSSYDCSPVVGAILGRPAPLGLVAVFRDSVARRLRVGASRLGLTASRLHVAASGLDSASGSWVGAVVASSAGRGWRVGAIARSVRVRRVGAVARVVARTVRLVRGVCGSGSVGDHHRGGLAGTESDGGRLSGVRTRTVSRCKRHAGVDGLSHCHNSSRRAFCGLVDVDRSSGRASVLDGSGLARLAGVSHSHRADRRAGRWNTSDSVGNSRDVRGQDVSDGERGAVVSRSAVRVDGRAVRHERGQSLGHWVSAGRVDDGGRGAWNVRGRRLSGSTSVLARSDGHNASRKASLGLSPRGVSHRACRECGVSCCSFGGSVVLGWRGVTSRVRRLATGWVHTATWVRRLSACRIHTTAWVRRRAVTLAVWCSRIDRWLTVRRCWVNWRLAVRVAVRCGWVHRRLAPDRAGGARGGRRPARVRVATSGIHWHSQRRAAGS
jgi:hypothetical protein